MSEKEIKLSGKKVLIDGELRPIEELQDNVETPKQAHERKELAKQDAELAKEAADKKASIPASMSKSKRELNDARRVKGLKALIAAKVPYDANWMLDEVMEACAKAKLLDENGKVMKPESEGDVEKVTPKEAKYRSDLQAQLMDADVDFDMNLDTDALEDIWEAYVDTLDEVPRDEYIRILKACDYELDEDLTDLEIKEEMETFRAELVEVATRMEIPFKGKELDVLYQEVLKAKDEQDDEDDNTEDDKPVVNADSGEPDIVATPKPEVKEKDLSDKEKVLLNARKDDLIAKIKKLGNADLKPTKAFGLPKLEAMWKANKPKL